MSSPGSDVTEVEDVLDEPSHEAEAESSPVERPPARSWRTRADFVALALIAVVSLVASVLTWAFSDARATTSVTGPSSWEPLPEAAALPPTLSEVWRAPSGATQSPAVVLSAAPQTGEEKPSSVVTGDGGTVHGRDPLTGDVRWTYERDLPLCVVSTAWGRAMALYSKGTNCSELTSLDGVTGERRAQRNGDAEPGTALLNEGSHLITTGSKFLEVYRRDDLVRSLEYGTLRAIVNPGKQPRTGCTYGSVAVSSGRFALIERCPDDASDRVSVLKPNPEHSDQPQVFASVLTGSKSSQVVAVTDKLVAVAVPNPARLLVFDAESGNQITEKPLDVPDADFTEPPNHVTRAFTTKTNVFWFSGSKTVALSLETLTPQWTADGTLGAGTTLAGRAVIPVQDGLRVYEQATGEVVGTVKLDREGHTGPVQLATAGSVVLEQRGGTLVALR
ncbi:PQQ-like domain-containing protein [Lentzea fradiae]|uniref:PQQ-like domain-containing protein n=1 Tax=Lentzea fradiae TaxID=200378 RepID=A0A1G7WTE4_9PSEU|nr:PQQ-binding-like beta-propeller repeat protein [Lentzea fradiae]SDG75166.1 PQQ-like domain-containing protein [Lentzea fradiae]